MARLGDNVTRLLRFPPRVDVTDRDEIVITFKVTEYFDGGWEEFFLSELDSLDPDVTVGVSAPDEIRALGVNAAGIPPLLRHLEAAITAANTLRDAQRVPVFAEAKEIVDAIRIHWQNLPPSS